jgi:hypothetical protein
MVHWLGQIVPGTACGAIYGDTFEDRHGHTASDQR